MNKESLVELGKEIAQEVNKMEEVKAVAFYGSIGLGYHDEKSDVDLVAYVKEIPDKDKRTNISKLSKGKFETQIDWTDVFHYKGVEFGVAYKEVSDLESDIGKLGEGHESGFIAMFIQDVRPIIGKDLISDLKDRIKDYPNELKDKKKEKLRGISRLFMDAEKLIGRNQKTFISFKSLESLERLTEVVYSVNERYYAKGNLKWFDKEMKRMGIVPENFVENTTKFTDLRPIEDFPERLKLLKEMMSSILEILEEVDRERLNIKSEDWYEEKIGKVRREVNSKIRSE